MKKHLPGRARGVVDPRLGALDPWLDPLRFGRELAAALGKPGAPALATVAVESARWKPGVALSLSWLCGFEDGGLERVTAKTFAEPGRAGQSQEKSGTRSLVEGTRLRAAGVASDGRTFLLVFPNDRAMPGLPRLADPARAKHVLGVGVGDFARSGLRVRARATRVEVVRFKPERRCVLRFAAGLADDRDGHKLVRRLYARVLPKADAARLVETLAVLEPLALPMARWLGFDAETGSVFHEEVAGTPLDERLADPRAHGAAGAALRAVHAIPAPAALRRERFAERCARTREESLDLASALGAELASEVARLLERIEALPGDDEVACVHGDFHPGQCILEGECVRCIDPDALAADDPSRDAGHYLAALEARARMGWLTPVEAGAARGAFLEGWARPAAAGLRREEALGLLEHALSPLRRLEGGAVARARTLLDRAAEIAGVARGARAVSTAPIPRGPSEWRDAVRDTAAGAGAEAADVVRLTPRAGGAAEVELELVSRGARSTFLGIWKGGLLREAPLDGSLAPHELAALLARLPEFAGAAPQEVGVRVLACRPARRATLLVTVALAAGGERRFVVRWHRSARALERARALASAATAPPGSVPPVVLPLLVDGATHRAVYPFVEGTELRRALLGEGPWRPDAVVETVRRFHALSPGEGSEFRGLEHELATIARLRARARECALAEPAGLDRIVGILDSRLRCAEPGPRAFLHRDLYERQILLDRDGVAWLLDLDTAGPGDPAVDAGNFLAHLEFARAEGADSARVGELATRLRALAEGRPRALSWCVAAALARMALVHGPRTAGSLPGRRAAALLLERADRWVSCGEAERRAP